MTFSDWAAPIVPVLKADKKSVRICGDFSTAVNKASRLDNYPIPKVEDLFVKLQGGTIFTKLDMSQAYQQLLLDEESKKYVVVNTHKASSDLTVYPLEYCRLLEFSNEQWNHYYKIYHQSWYILMTFW